MERKIAKEIRNILVKCSEQDKSSIIVTLKPNTPVFDFHQWADGKPFEGGFLVDSSYCKYWLLILEWNSNKGFYVVLFPEDKSGPVAEIHKITEEDGTHIIHWRYSPSKHDGKNDLRKEYFTKYFLDLNVSISLPKHLDEVEEFLNECGSLIINRLKADDLDPNTPSYREGFPEGKQKEKLHLSRERNSRLINEVKKDALRRCGKLECECCGFDFEQAYGELGKEFIEAHHLVPVSELHPNGGETKEEDIALVCSNCHRMLHRRRPWLGFGELKNITRRSN